MMKLPILAGAAYFLFASGGIARGKDLLAPSGAKALDEVAAREMIERAPSEDKETSMESAQ